MPLPDLRDRPRTARGGKSNADSDDNSYTPHSYRNKVREKILTKTPRGGGGGGSDNSFDMTLSEGVGSSALFDNRGHIDLNLTREYTFFRPTSSRNGTRPPSNVGGESSSRLAFVRTPRSREIILYNRQYRNNDENEVNDDDDEDVSEANHNGNDSRPPSTSNSRRESNHNHINNDNDDLIYDGRKSSTVANRPDSREAFYNGGNNNYNNQNSGSSSPRLRSSYLARRHNNHSSESNYENASNK